MSGSILKGAAALYLSSIDWFSAIHLKCIMPLDAPYRLLQAPSPPMPVIRVGRPVLVEYDTVAWLRILRVMDIPDMPGILRHDGHIIGIRTDNIKI